MFCPKCGVENPEKVKFCRRCGCDLSLIPDVMSGKLTVGDVDKNKPTWEAAMIFLALSLAFFIVSIILAFQPMGAGWWFWLLFAGFTMLALGVAQVLNLKQARKDKIEISSEKDASLPDAENAGAFPPKQTEPVSDIVDIKEKSGDLVPPSVVEGTTRKLEMNAEGETMHLPKKDE